MTAQKENNFKVGDKVVYFDKICRIFDKKEGIIYFRHYFKNTKHRNLVFSIPIENIERIKIRKPFSKSKVKEWLNGLSVRSKKKNTMTTVKLRELLKQNIPVDTKILKQLWDEKNNNSDNFTPSRRELFKLTMAKLQEEIAFVLEISLLKAREKITFALTK